MHQVGRIRIAVHGYTTAEDIEKLLAAEMTAGLEYVYGADNIELFSLIPAFFVFSGFDIE